VEQNSVLIENQKNKLARYDDINWHKNLNFLKEINTPFIVIANEFLDALPVKQFKVENEEVFERCISYKNGEFFFDYKPVKDSRLYKWYGVDLEDGFYEVSEQQVSFLETIIKNKYFRRGLFIDYGYIQGNGDSLQSIYKHKINKIFDNIGLADLTTHVNFAYLSAFCKSLGLESDVMTQGEFLNKMGIQYRFKQLFDIISPDETLTLKEGMQRLCSPEQMGELFKVLIVKK
jgi:NADH dehydrogenase [ubiquinone] 1 alpha subcomplex assembly factor 7